MELPVSLWASFFKSFPLPTYDDRPPVVYSLTPFFGNIIWAAFQVGYVIFCWEPEANFYKGKLFFNNIYLFTGHAPHLYVNGHFILNDQTYKEVTNNYKEFYKYLENEVATNKETNKKKTVEDKAQDSEDDEDEDEDNESDEEDNSTSKKSGKKQSKEDDEESEEEEEPLKAKPKGKTKATTQKGPTKKKTKTHK